MAVAPVQPMGYSFGNFVRAVGYCMLAATVTETETESVFVVVVVVGYGAAAVADDSDVEVVEEFVGEFVEKVVVFLAYSCF